MVKGQTKPGSNIYIFSFFLYTTKLLNPCFFFLLFQCISEFLTKLSLPVVFPQLEWQTHPLGSAFQTVPRDDWTVPGSDRGARPAPGESRQSRRQHDLLLFPLLQGPILTTLIVGLSAEQVGDDVDVCLQEKLESSTKPSADGMGVPEIKYGDSNCLVQHVDSGLWLTYQSSSAVSSRMGVTQRKVNII